VLAVSVSCLTWTKGGPEAASEYFSTALIKARGFCATCGTGLYSRRADRPEVIRIRVGTISPGSDIDHLKIGNHIHVDESGDDRTVPGWAKIVGDDGAPRWPGVEPGRV
jgi:hypothetical protein